MCSVPWPGNEGEISECEEIHLTHLRRTIFFVKYGCWLYKGINAPQTVLSVCLGGSPPFSPPYRDAWWWSDRLSLMHLWDLSLSCRTIPLLSLSLSLALHTHEHTHESGPVQKHSRSVSRHATLRRHYAIPAAGRGCSPQGAPFLRRAALLVYYTLNSLCEGHFLGFKATFIHNFYTSIHIISHLLSFFVQSRIIFSSHPTEHMAQGGKSEMNAGLVAAFNHYIILTLWDTALFIAFDI